MSTTLEPREVDRPFFGRWLRATLVLVVRSPVRFGLVIAILGLLDTEAVRLASGYVVERQWVEWLGFLLLPLLWAFVSAIARGADDTSQTRSALEALARRSVCGGVLWAGARLAAIVGIVWWSLHGIPALLGMPKPAPYLRHSGDLIMSVAVAIVIVTAGYGICFFPLLTLVPGIAGGDARVLSRKASVLNGGPSLHLLLVGTMAVVAVSLGGMIPAHGMTLAAFLVFMGVFNYVAYRDIFERRAQNLPQASAVAAATSAQTAR